MELLLTCIHNHTSGHCPFCSQTNSSQTLALPSEDRSPDQTLPPPMEAAPEPTIAADTASPPPAALPDVTLTPPDEQSVGVLAEIAPKQEASERIGGEVTKGAPPPVSDMTLTPSESPDSSEGPTRNLRPQPAVAVAPTRLAERNATQQRNDAGNVMPPSARAGSVNKLPHVPGYEILRELGRGAMGVVYLARQQKLNRLVAMKMILHAGNAGKRDLDRFAAEAQAVAQLRHPNVVQVFESGDSEGRPFFALEFVDGGALDEKVGNTPLPPRDAARVVELLARGMDAAHRCHIIHRDLKPANVLLQKPDQPSECDPAAPGSPSCSIRGQVFIPKVNDFGLAKSLEGDSKQTRDGTVMGTPSYMAPEQAEGKISELTPAADVYGLGAILYDLLTSRPPFRGTTAIETLQLVLQSEPLPPQRLAPNIAPDLQIICLKCLDKDPRRRYATGGELAEDLRRFLENRPIRARPTPWWERAWKWIRRHPSGAGLIGVSVATLLCLAIGGVLYAQNERFRADEASRLRAKAEAERTEAVRAHALAIEAQQAEGRQRQRAEGNLTLALGAVEELSKVGHRRLAREPHMELVRRDILEKALDFHAAFIQANGDEPRLRHELALAQMRAGEVQEMLGRDADAEKSLRGSLGLLKNLLDDDPQRADFLQGAGAAWNDLGVLLLKTGRRVEAAQAYAEAVKAKELFLALHSEPTAMRDLASTQLNLGILYQTGRQPVDAERAFNTARTLLERASDLRPDDREVQEALAQAWLSLGAVRTGRDCAGAESAYASALTHWSALAAAVPDEPRFQQHVALTHLNRGALLQLDVKRRVEAEADYTKARALLESLSGRFRSVPDYRHQLGNTYQNLGLLLRASGRLAEAEKVWRLCSPVLASLIADFPGEPRHRQMIGRCGNEWAITLASTNRCEEALKVWREALVVQDRLVRDQPMRPYWQDRIDSRTNLVAVLTALGPSEEAERESLLLVESHRQRISAFPEEADYCGQTAAAWKARADLLTARKKPDNARTALSTAIAEQRSLSRTANTRRVLAVYERLLLENRLTSNDAAGAATVLEQLLSDVPDEMERNPVTDRVAAGVLMRCATLAVEKEPYCARAMELLRRTKARDPQSLKGLRDAIEFSSLHGRADFVELLEP